MHINLDFNHLCVLLLAPESCGVYYLKNSRGDVLYIGKAGARGIKERLKDHLREGLPGVTRFGFTACLNESQAGALESFLIGLFNPPLNVKERTNLLSQYLGDFTN